MQKKRIVELEIKKFSNQGNGLGYFENQNGIVSCVEVPFSAPGDVVKAFLTTKRKGCYKGFLEEVLAPSPDRIPPQCIHFASCGGCRWQHLPYEYQLAQKSSFVQTCFKDFLSTSLTVNPIIPCSPPWHYRNKMEFSFSMNAAKEKFLGLIKDSSKGRVLNLTECHLVNPWFIDCLKIVRDWWEESDLEAYHPGKNTGALRTLTVREGIRTGDRMVILTVSGNPDYALKKHQLEKLTAAIQSFIQPSDPASYLSIFLRIQQIAKGMPTNFYEMQLAGPDHIREILHVTYDPSQAPLSLMFKISPAAFFQPSTRQAERLYSLALQYARIPKDSIVYDLYCGTGTLGICAAKLAKKVIGIELSPEASLDAKANVAANGFDNVEVICGSVSESLDMLGNQSQPPIVLIDPPRAGLEDKAIRNILNLNPSKIIYISCNPITQALNMPNFLESGYQISAIQPVDQFAQTRHVENIVVLEKG